MKKVLLFVQDVVGGAERMTALIGRELDAKSFDVCFCLIKCDSSSTIADFLPRHIRRKIINRRNGFLCLLSMIKKIVEERPDYVFSSVINLNTKLLLIRFFFPKIKFIIRGDNYLYTYTPKQKKLISYTYPKADLIIAQTEEMKEEMVNQIGVDANKIRVLHNPIDKKTINIKISGAINPYQEINNKCIVAVGRFSAQKGFDLLIDAFIEVYNKNTNTELFIVGDTTVGNGEVAKTVMKKAEDAKISEHVHFCGYQNNPYPYLKYADCFVLSSRWEGLPNVLIESLYLGTPVAAFKCIPIIERIVEEGKTGYCAEKDDVKALADAINNTLLLGRISSTYKSATMDDFIELF